MGKNSNVHKSLATLAEDVRKEREADEKKAKKRAKAEERLANQRGEMLVEGSSSGGKAAAGTSAKKKTFGKVRTSAIGKVKIAGSKKAKQSKPGYSAIKPSLQLKKSGIRKPSSLMKKTLRKIARQQDSMVL